MLYRRIKDFRVKKGMTQADLAEKLEISITQMSNIENGIRSPSIETFIKMCLALDKPAECFFNPIKKDTILSSEKIKWLQAMNENILDKIQKVLEDMEWYCIIHI